MAHSQASTEEVQLVPADSNASHNKTVTPKTIVLHRVSNSFGFTLRHFIVYAPEVISSVPSNESRTINGIDNEPSRSQQIDAIFVRQVSPNGPADKAGLSSGDQVVSVNGIHITNKSYKQVIDLIQKSHDSVELGIIPKEECILQLVSPVMTVSHQSVNKAKLTDTTTSPSITSTMTIAPSQPSTNDSQSSASLMVSISDPPDNVTRRSSVDRHAQENRNYVVSNKYDEVNNNSDENKKSNQGTKGPGGGTFFFATTDYTGKPKALHFQRGTNLDQLQVVDNGKSRSKSLPSVEMEGFQNWQERHKHNIPSQRNGPKMSMNESSLEININQPENKPVLSSSRVVASDSPSTVNVSTNSDFMSRQPIAREPKRRPSTEESSSFLVKTISSHMNRERSPSALQSSTVGATLLESQPTGNSDASQPINVQTNQVSVYTNSSEQIQLSLSNETGDRFGINKKQQTFEERRAQQAGTSPRQRRTSYLMATNAANRNSTKSKPSGISYGGVVKKTPTLSSALSSTFMTPMMAHVSSGTDTPKDEAPMDEDEIFVDNETGIDVSLGPRVGRRISYVMATSSSTSPRVVLEGMKEEDEQSNETVSGLMEVIKEGFLWKKLVVRDGGKRSSSRSWKAVYCILRGHVLYSHKDRDSAHQTKPGDSGDDQQPISIKSCIIDIAHDYTKRKNVFRLTTFNGWEYLFQCEDESSMLKWIEAIQSNNNPDEDESGVTSQSLIIRRMKNVEQESTGTSHSSGHKLTPTPAKIPNFSNLKKSLSFKNISGIQNKDEGSKNKWNKSSKKRKKQSPNMVNYVQGHSIGVPLEMCPMSRVIKCVPVLVEHCCDVIDKKGIECVGVYRVPGNSAAVSLLQDEVNNKGAESVNFEEEKWHDVNNITSLLKQFLRKLPEGLLTADLYEGFIEANKKEDPVERMWALKCLINELPEHSFETLKFLLAHLKRIADNAETNKMEARNLAIVFGPTLVRTGEDTMISMVKDMSDQCRIVETLLTHSDWFFEESGEGDEPPSKPPVSAGGQDHFVSMRVLSSLGQAAGNFGEDGNMKSKSGGGLAHISLHIPKFRGKHSKSESHDSSSPEAVMSDGSVSPTLDRGGLPIRAAAGSCPGSPTQERHKLAPKRSSDLTSLSTGSITPAFEVVDDSRIRGSSSLKAYSYARPPPPSYRKVGPQRGMNQTSEPGPEAMPVCVTFTGPTTPESEIAPKFEYDPDQDSHTSKPSFASLSEETRLRLLKVSLHQKAMEKKRQSESSSPGLSPPSSSHFDASDDSHPRKSTDSENFGSSEHLPSSSNTSRSSSTPSSKTASLDSLHQSDNPEGRKIHPARVTTSGGWKATPSQSTVTPNPPPPIETSETVVTVVQGKDVKSSAGEAKRRPSSSDIRARRNTAEGLRVRPSMQSESSDSSSEDEASELQLNMSKSFDEKLRILLDLNYPFNQDGRKKVENDEIPSSEHSRKLSIDKHRQSSESDRHSVDDNRSSTCSLPVSNSERRPSFELKPPTRRRVSVDGTETRTTIQIEPRKISTLSSPPDRRPSSETTKTVINVDTQRKNSFPGGERHSAPLQPVMGRVRTTTPVALKEFKIASATFRKDLVGAGQRGQPRKVVHKDSPIIKAKTEESSITISPAPSPRSSYGSLARSPRSSVTDASPRNSFGESPRNSRSEVNINLSRSQRPSQGERKPSAQTEHKSLPNSERKPPSEAERASQVNQKSPSQSERRLPSEEDRKPLPQAERKSLPQTDRKTHSQSERKSLSKSERKPPQTERKPPSKYAAMAARLHQVEPKVMGRESGVKPKTFPRDGGQRRDILPSKGRHTFKEPGREKQAHHLETNAQHIADLLEEMHSERLKMMRQRSDISGQAQKAAAQRAASRRRRRSVGDENEPNLKELEVKDTDEDKDCLLKTSSDVTRYKWSAEQQDIKQATNRVHPGSTKKGKSRKDYN
ncbi:rho GTPase-activating protein 21 [Exaiptasia diaphana]|uniref:Rho GTPase-activating protein 21 n=1 Tax=Exaiptasia diaphana TaxID=2652724 RepID=A0A913YBX2_EXADI|nr:rho GTPase-activating protein 21 [Exaiptasia diaphana]KXJ28295.1 Rho GTPase-activating protein 21 [Exaiptasia diaphana]